MAAMISVSDYKTEILADMCASGKIVEGIDSQQAGYVPGEPDSLLYRNLFPYLRVPETQTLADTYILLSVDIDRVSRHNRTYARYATVMWALAHMDRMEMPARFRSTRIDFIAEELIGMFHGQRKFGFSEFELISSKEVLLDVKYMYRELTFVCDDLRQPAELGAERRRL